MEQIAKTDAELVADALAGDREAFGQLYDRHARRVRAVVLAVSGDWSAVEDLAQECFLRAYRKLDTLRDCERFGAWLSGFARQVGRERRRTLRRDRHEFGAAAADVATIDDRSNLARREDISQLMERVAQLPEDERLAIHSYFFTEQNATAAAAQLEISRSGFYTLLQRALARLATRPLLRKEIRDASKSRSRPSK
ncbi:MAG: RNA polymerase sigma factor [Pirellulales bacterium]